MISEEVGSRSEELWYAFLTKSFYWCESRIDEWVGLLLGDTVLCSVVFYHKIDIFVAASGKID